MKKYFWLAGVLLFCLGCIFVYQSINYNDKKLHIIACDVGQGDAILIKTPQNTDILIDGGPDDSILSCLGKHLPFWDRTIEIVILTHPHADHFVGLISVMKKYKILSFNAEKIENPSAAYIELLKQVKEDRVGERFLVQGDKFRLKDGVILETLWPTKDWIDQNSLSEAKSDVNGSSIIEKLSYGKFSILFTGDSQSSVLNKISSLIGKMDVFKVPHHGSKTGLNSEILDVLSPKLAIISVGKNNKYGHPAILTVDFLNQFKIKILRTDEKGDIEIISEGNNFLIKN